jgi:hypothetical protein
MNFYKPNEKSLKPTMRWFLIFNSEEELLSLLTVGTIYEIHPDILKFFVTGNVYIDTLSKLFSIPRNKKTLKEFLLDLFKDNHDFDEFLIDSMAEMVYDDEPFYEVKILGLITAYSFQHYE